MTVVAVGLVFSSDNSKTLTLTWLRWAENIAYDWIQSFILDFSNTIQFLDRRFDEYAKLQLAMLTGKLSNEILLISWSFVAAGIVRILDSLHTSLQPHYPSIRF